MSRLVSIGTALRFSMSDHDTQSPATPDELRTLAAEMEAALIESEANFAHEDWRYVDGLLALADQLTAAVSSHEARDRA